MTTISRLLAILFTASAANAATLPFVWDQGTERDQADRMDIVLDVAKACNAPDIGLNLPGVLEKPLPRLADPDPARTLRAFARLGIHLPQAALGALAEVFDSNVGEGALFVLLPEAHKSMGGPAEKHRHEVLQITESFLAMAVIEATKGVVLNLREGVVGPAQRRDFPLEGADRATQLWNQVQRVHGAPFANLAYLYQDDSRVVSSYLEDGNAIAMELLLTFGQMTETHSFEETLANVEKNYGSAVGQIIQLRSTYDQLAKMNFSNREFLRGQLCVIRGEQMATKTLQLAKEKRAEVIFLGYGSSHHAEIAAVLRKANRNFVALQPRLLPPEN